MISTSFTSIFRWVWLVLLAGLLIVPFRTSLAQSTDDKIIINHCFVLHAGETHIGTIVLIDGTFTLDDEAEVVGDVVIISGIANLAGEIDGDLTVLGGKVYLANSLNVTGKQSLITGEFLSEPADDLANEPAQDPTEQKVDETANFSNSLPSLVQQKLSDWASAWRKNIGGVIGITAFSLVVLAVFPQQIVLVGQTIRQHPLESSFTGILSLILLGPIGFVMSLLALTCILSPITLAFWAGVSIVALFGWVSMGNLLAQAFAQRYLKPERYSPLLVGVTGVLLLSLGAAFALTLAQFMPWAWLGIWLLLMGVGSVGFGAAVLSRLGRQPYKSVQHALTINP
jgi:hypothetical protein